MLTDLLALIAIMAACGAFVRRAHRVNGRPVPADPYEAADDATDDHDDAVRAELQQRFGDAWTKNAVRQATIAAAQPRALPRRLLRRIPLQIPPHVDPPLTDEQLAVVRARWPLMVSSLLRDDAER